MSFTLRRTTKTSNGDSHSHTFLTDAVAVVAEPSSVSDDQYHGGHVRLTALEEDDRRASGASRPKVGDREDPPLPRLPDCD